MYVRFGKMKNICRTCVWFWGDEDDDEDNSVKLCVSQGRYETIIIWVGFQG